MIKESGEVYLLFPDGDFLLTYVNSSSSYPHYLDLMPDWIFWIAAFKCKKCNSTSLDQQIILIVLTVMKKYLLQVHLLIMLLHG